MLTFPFSGSGGTSDPEIVAFGDGTAGPFDITHSKGENPTVTIRKTSDKASVVGTYRPLDATTVRVTTAPVVVGNDALEAVII